MRRYSLRDDQWERIKDLLPGREGYVGGTAVNNRLFVEAVLYRYRAGVEAPPNNRILRLLVQLKAKAGSLLHVIKGEFRDLARLVRHVVEGMEGETLFRASHAVYG